MEYLCRQMDRHRQSLLFCPQQGAVLVEYAGQLLDKTAVLVVVVRLTHITLVEQE